MYNAKILPWTTPGSLNAPLIALVIHGPAPRSDASSSGDDHTPPSEGKSGASSDSLQGSPRIHGLPLEETEPIEYYQTTVEVYSLGTKAHVATLLSLPKTRIALPTTSPVFRPPLPVGSLSIRADIRDDRRNLDIPSRGQRERTGEVQMHWQDLDHGTAWCHC